MGVAEPEWGLLITHKLQIHQPVVTGAAARLQLDLADGTFEATFVHCELLALDFVLEHVDPVAANMAELLCGAATEVH